MGPETLAVRQTYLEWRVAPMQMGRVPDDHIALELGFMAHLSQAACQALEEKDDHKLAKALEAGCQFLTDHLSSWVPRFCADLSQASREPFFQGLASLTSNYLLSVIRESEPERRCANT